MKMVHSLTACVVSLATALTATAATSETDWPEFRGPGGMGVSQSKGVPVTWNDKDNILWKIAMPGPGTSSPIVYGDHIYLSYFSGYKTSSREPGQMENLELHLLCLNRVDGKILWDKKVTPELPEQDKIREEHGYASGTPAADADAVYVSFGKSGVFAFNHKGDQLWKTSVGTKLNGWGSAISPVLYKDLVIVNASVESESVIALDRKKGTEVWRAPGVKEAWNKPLLINNSENKTELIVPMMGKVLAFDPDKGESLWRCDNGIGWYICPSAVASDGVVYSIGGRSGIAAVAVKAGGRGNVTSSHLLWKINKGSNVSSPIYHDGHLYYAHENLGILYCVEAKTGNVVYEERITPEPGQFYPSPVMADGKIYYVSRSGSTVVVAAKPKFEQLSYNKLAGRDVFNASPAITGKRILLRSNRSLYCIGES